jgi:hypothetical protein
MSAGRRLPLHSHSTRTMSQRASPRCASWNTRQIGQSSQSSKNQTNSSDTRKFFRDTTKNCVHPLIVPFENDMCRGGVWVGRDIIIWVAQSFRIKRHQKCCFDESKGNHALCKLEHKANQPHTHTKERPPHKWRMHQARAPAAQVTHLWRGSATEGGYN